MNQFIIVLLSMLVILTLTKFLINEEVNENNQDVTLDFDSNKIKCKCNIEDPKIKENFANFNNEFVAEKPKINENIITSIENLKGSKHTNITAETFFENKFKYPISPLVNNNYVVYPSNAYEYMNLGKDSDKINNI